MEPCRWKIPKTWRNLLRCCDNWCEVMITPFICCRQGLFFDNWGVALTMFGCNHGIFIVFNLGILGKKSTNPPLFSLGISHSSTLVGGLRLCCDLGSSSTTRWFCRSRGRFMSPQLPMNLCIESLCQLHPPFITGFWGPSCRWWFRTCFFLYKKSCQTGEMIHFDYPRN